MATTRQSSISAPRSFIPARFQNWLFEQIDGHVLGLFRLIFGLFMLYECWHYADVQLIDAGLLAPKILFKYEGFEWLPLLPRPVLQVLLGGMAVGAAMMALGAWSRWGGWMFALGQAYFMLMEKAYFNNHIYFYTLISVLLTFTDADHFVSARGNRGYGATVPRWQLFILQLQVIVLYFFGGVAKLAPDWMLRQEPVRTLLQSLPQNHFFAPLLRNEFGAYLLTYGGFVLDFFAPLFLYYKPLRRWALWAFIGFHLTNSSIFDDIGVFPFVTLTATILFFETENIPFVRRLSGRSKMAESPGVAPVMSPVLRYTLLGWFAFQFIFPLRIYLLPNEGDYTTVGNRFSWHMKINTRVPEEMTFMVVDPATRQEQRVEIQTFVNDYQIGHLASDPRSVAAFARMIRDEMARRGVPGVAVKARIRFKYNGRSSQFFVNPQVDLAKVDVSPFHFYDWVMPVVSAH